MCKVKSRRFRFTINSIIMILSQLATRDLSSLDKPSANSTTFASTNLMHEPADIHLISIAQARWSPCPMYFLCSFDKGDVVLLWTREYDPTLVTHARDDPCRVEGDA
jgi:hypothetical protein